MGQAKPWDFLNPNTEYVDKEEFTKRFKICQQCPIFISLTNQCRQCGCFMNLKAKMKHAACPIGSW
jgi:hypothetical protein